MKSLLSRKDIVNILGHNSLTLRRLNDCTAQKRMNLFRKENPCVLGQVLKDQRTLVGSCVTLWDESVELCTRKQHRCYLRIFGRCCHQGHVEVAGPPFTPFVMVGT